MRVFTGMPDPKVLSDLVGVLADGSHLAAFVVKTGIEDKAVQLVLKGLKQVPAAPQLEGHQAVGDETAAAANPPMHLLQMMVYDTQVGSDHAFEIIYCPNTEGRLGMEVEVPAES